MLMVISVVVSTTRVDLQYIMTLSMFWMSFGDG